MTTDSISTDQLRHLSREAVLEEVGPSKLGYWIIVIVLAGFVLGLVWAAMFTVKTSTRTEGEVVPSGDERMVQHLEGGIVREIVVQNGDLVKKNDVLLRFDPTARSAELDQIRARRAGLTIKAARLRAYIDGKDPDFGDLAQEYPEQVEEATFTLNATRERVAGQKAVLQSQIEQRKKTVEIQTKKAASLREQVSLLKEAVAMRESLFKSGHGSRVNLINSKLEYARALESQTEAESTAEQAEASIQEAENEMQSLDISERGQAIEELSNLLAELGEVREQVKRLQDKVTRLDVLAPVGGVIHGLKVNTAGAVVEPADVLLSLIPMDEQVVVEARLDPKDIGHVRVGQPAKVSIRGFDVRRYGTIPGELVKVSPSTFRDADGQTYFKARVVLHQDSITGAGSTHRIVPGMSVDVDVITGEKSLLEYLIGPIYTAMTGAFSER